MVLNNAEKCLQNNANQTIERIYHIPAIHWLRQNWHASFSPGFGKKILILHRFSLSMSIFPIRNIHTLVRYDFPWLHLHTLSSADS